jgi:L-amino acid N-acyltransferase YncA
MKVRPARLDDALTVLAWRNDPVTRAMSRDQEETPVDGHLAWFGGAIADPDRLVLIGDSEGRAAGMVRFDRADGEWEVSINVAPEARGQGAGRALLAEALATFDGAHPGAAVLAWVKPENLASVRLFEAVGFGRCGEEDGLLRYRRPAH